MTVPRASRRRNESRAVMSTSRRSPSSTPPTTKTPARAPTTLDGLLAALQSSPSPSSRTRPQCPYSEDQRFQGSLDALNTAHRPSNAQPTRSPRCYFPNRTMSPQSNYTGNGHYHGLRSSPFPYLGKGMTDRRTVNHQAMRHRGMNATVKFSPAPAKRPPLRHRSQPTHGNIERFPQGDTTDGSTLTALDLDTSHRPEFYKSPRRSLTTSVDLHP